MATDVGQRDRLRELSLFRELHVRSRGDDADLRLARRDATIKKTQITDVFTLEDFHLTHGKDAIVLFLHSEDRGLRPAAADLEKVPPATTLYALVPPNDTENELVKQIESTRGT